MAGRELAAEQAGGLPDVGAQHPGDHLGAELLALDAGDGRELPQLAAQPVDSAAEDPFDPRRQGGPVDTHGLEPPTFGIAGQRPPVLQCTQHFDGEQGVAGGLAEQVLPKALPEAVRFAVDEGVDKGAVTDPVELDREL